MNVLPTKLQNGKPKQKLQGKLKPTERKPHGGTGR